MGFEVREPGVSDLDRCLTLLASPYLCEPALYPQLRAFWLEILSSRCGEGAVVADPSDPRKIIGFSFQVYVSDRQADEYQQCRSPLIAQRILAEWIGGHRMFLDLEQIARANAGAGLNLLVMHYGASPGDPRITASNYEVFRRVVRGWNFRSYTAEMFISPERRYRDFGKSAGYRVMEYSDEVLRAAGIPAENAPFLWVATRKDAAASQGYAVKLLFESYTPPRAGFTRLEQELLDGALEGDTDASLAKNFGLSQSAVKKHFRKIYEKAYDAQLADFRNFAHVNGNRGAEMRRGLLNYLRDHPEELRPYLNGARRRG